jgi:putative tryptophan/tyrosine transport system substrate-binding protein
MTDARRRQMLMFAPALWAAPAAALAQTGAKLPRIGYLSLQSITEVMSRERQAFLNGLRDLGYVPGQTIEIVYASAEGEAEFLEATCADLIKKKVELIVTSGTQAALAAQKTTRSVPIVTLALGDPLGIGLVKSLARPGGNVTGVSFLLSELAAKRMQLLREMVPTVAHVGVLWNAANPNSINESRAALAGAKALKLTALDMPINAGQGVSAALKSIEGRKNGALYVTFDSGVMVSHRSEIAEFGLRHRVPIVSGWNFLTEAGGLLSYAPDHPATYYRAAYYVHRILRGANPGDLPVEQVRTVDFVINLKTAKLLGLNVPNSIRVRANQVIE